MVASRIRKALREDVHLQEIIGMAKAEKAVGFVMQAGVLFKICRDDNEKGVVVPRSLQSQLIRL